MVIQVMALNCELIYQDHSSKDPQPLNGFSNGYRNGLSSSLRDGNGDSSPVVRLGKYCGKTPLPQHIEQMKNEVC